MPFDNVQQAMVRHCAEIISSWNEYNTLFQKKLVEDPRFTIRNIHKFEHHLEAGSVAGIVINHLHDGDTADEVLAYLRERVMYHSLAAFRDGEKMARLEAFRLLLDEFENMV